MGLKWLQYKDGMWESLSCEEVQMRIQKAVRKILHSTGLSVVLSMLSMMSHLPVQRFDP